MGPQIRDGLRLLGGEVFVPEDTTQSKRLGGLWEGNGGGRGVVSTRGEDTWWSGIVMLMLCVAPLLEGDLGLRFGS